LCDVGQRLQQLAFPEIESVADLAVGKMVRGYVTETSAGAVFVALSRSLSARITRRELGRSPVKKIGVAFPVGKLVEAKVKSIGKRKSASSSPPPSLFFFLPFAHASLSEMQRTKLRLS
jgi:ribosomal protein S1